ncbi:MAG TPA: hypothetical protein VMQ45_06925 [Burkholderiaceae bacterium]|nr:hypothetical protein [Burkholderiaceae bacterium]
MRVAIAGLLVLCWACADAQPRGDACQAQIPRSLERALAAAFPGYRTPLEFDNVLEDIQRNRSRGGTGCLGVAMADFTGEGKKDYVIGLTARKGSSGLAVIALPKKGGWNFKKITSWTEDARYQQYVDVVEPGQHDRTTEVTAALGPGEKRSMDCPNWGALVGTVRATRIVYCYDEGRWSHVWVSD